MESFLEKNNDGSYNLVIDNYYQGTFYNVAKKTANTEFIDINNKQYKIRRSGFWSNTIEFFDDIENKILSVTPKNWYGNKYTIEYNDQTFTLRIGNNPLTEWSIHHDSSLQLAYALEIISGKPGLKVSVQSKTPVLFHFLLWYLIEPVVLENAGEG